MTKKKEKKVNRVTINSLSKLTSKHKSIWDKLLNILLLYSEKKKEEKIEKGKARKIEKRKNKGTFEPPS